MKRDQVGNVNQGRRYLTWTQYVGKPVESDELAKVTSQIPRFCVVLNRITITVAYDRIRHSSPFSSVSFHSNQLP